MHQAMHGHSVSALSSLSCSTSRPCVSVRHTSLVWSRRPARRTTVMPKASAEGGATPNNDGPQAISLVRQLPGPEVTFVLAGFLKILTIGGLASSAPIDAVRTAAGKMSPYLMFPVGLVMCWIAKVIVDNELQESRRFMGFLITFLVFLYFGLYRVLYRYDPGSSPYIANTPDRGPRASRVGQVRAQMGDRDLLEPGGKSVSGYKAGDWEAEGTLQDTRARTYESAYSRRGYDMDGEGEADSTAVLDARNPARRHQKRL